MRVRGVTGLNDQVWKRDIFKVYFIRPIELDPNSLESLDRVLNWPFLRINGRANVYIPYPREDV
jgi:hypothetical protein